MIGRKVKVFKREAKINVALGMETEIVEDGEGMLLEFGIGCAPYPHTMFSITMAIIERPDGHVDLIEPELIQFMDKTS